MFCERAPRSFCDAASQAGVELSVPLTVPQELLLSLCSASVTGTSSVSALGGSSSPLSHCHLEEDKNRQGWQTLENSELHSAREPARDRGQNSLQAASQVSVLFTTSPFSRPHFNRPQIMVEQRKHHQQDKSAVLTSGPGNNCIFLWASSPME